MPGWIWRAQAAEAAPRAANPGGGLPPLSVEDDGLRFAPSLKREVSMHDLREGTVYHVVRVLSAYFLQQERQLAAPCLHNGMALVSSQEPEQESQDGMDMALAASMELDGSVDDDMKTVMARSMKEF